MNIINDITGKIIKHMAYLADKPLSGQAALTGAVEDTLGLMMEIGADIISRSASFFSLVLDGCYEK